MLYKLNLEEITLTVSTLKIFFMSIFTYYTYLKITDFKINFNKKQLFNIIYIALISIVVSFLRDKLGYLISVIALIFLLSLLSAKSTKNNLGYSILSVTIALSINYILFFIEIIITFLINNIYAIKSDFINLAIMLIIQLSVLYRISKIKRIEHGISYLNKKSNDEYLDIIILNISVIIVYSFVIFSNMDIMSIFSKNLFINFIIVAIVMFGTISKSIQLYYKQKLLVKDFEKKTAELEEKTKEIEHLEKENLEISKKSHSLAHKQKSLEYKLEQLMMQTENARNLSIKDELENISKEIFVVPTNIETTKTDILEIDDMVNTIQLECDKHNIEFKLQVVGNVHYMLNNLIAKEEMEILLADHIKDAIIAINHSDNINKSILLKIGKIEGFYGIYIYDSGVEFEKETLENLGKKPVTTYEHEGGTGMGFMNTFDILRKYKASLIIKELNKPSNDNFTKVVIFRFDGNNEYRIDTYK